jgi:hypothetical protein
MANASARLSVKCDLTYTLIERLLNGEVLSEQFPAHDDNDAIDRVAGVLHGGGAELWRGPLLVRAWAAPALKASDGCCTAERETSHLFYWCGDASNGLVKRH